MYGVCILPTKPQVNSQSLVQCLLLSKFQQVFIDQLTLPTPNYRCLRLKRSVGKGALSLLQKLRIFSAVCK